MDHSRALASVKLDGTYFPIHEGEQTVGKLKINLLLENKEDGLYSWVVYLENDSDQKSPRITELYGMDIDKIEYAAEIALEHHLGLTCDPICGLVQIPCIERNAVAAMRAINAANLANLLFDTRKISFDKVVIAMKETGDDMSPAYKETSEAGLAKITVK